MCDGVTRLMFDSRFLERHHHLGQVGIRDLAAVSRRLVPQFWQNTHNRLQEPKKIVPDPREPTSGASSPKCA